MITLYLLIKVYHFFTDTIIRQSVTSQNKLEWLSGSVGKSLNCSGAEKLKTDSMTATVVGLRIQPFEVKDNDFAKQSK